MVRKEGGEWCIVRSGTECFGDNNTCHWVVWDKPDQELKSILFAVIIQ